MAKKDKEVAILPDEHIARRIYIIRKQKVMLDRDLAELYGVETRILKRNVRRHIKRFPDDFMFELSNQEFAVLKSQFGISKRGGTRFMPMAFSEQGVAMLSSVLNSDRAIEVNIQIMRTFSKMREMLATHADLRRKIEEMEQKYDENFKIVFEAIQQLFVQEDEPKRQIGYVEKP